MYFVRIKHGILVYLAATMVVVGCQPGPASNPSSTTGDCRAPRAEGPAIAVTSPYLEAVATDLLGRPTIIVLGSPGACPGHFDLRPSQIERLASAALLLRLDFQNSLEEKLAGRLGNRLAVLPVSVPGGMCDPSAYEAACRQVADSLVRRGMLSAEQSEARLADISARMKTLRAWMKSQVSDARLVKTPVVASRHQEEFCRLLGLDVVATLGSADTARASMLDRAVAEGEQAGVKWIIANRPEGRRLADVVADRLGARVLMFDNFPEPGRSEAFDRLVRANVRVLVEGARQ